jgi:hypothetical protein
MDFLILNDASIPFQSHADANRYFPVFLEIVFKALQHGVKAVRVGNQEQTGWFNTQLTHDIWVYDWLAQQPIDVRRKIKALMDKSSYPFIPEEEVEILNRFNFSNFCLKENNECPTPALGATYLLKQVAISFNSYPVWSQNPIDICGEELTYEGNIVSFETSVRNCSTLQHWVIYEEELKVQQRESLRKGVELWKLRQQQFPNLVFCGKTEKQLKGLPVSIETYNQLFNALTKLNDYCSEEKNFTLEDIKEETQLNMSDESDTVKQKPKLKRHRMFQINNKREFFGIHVKIMGKEFRLHIFPLKSECKIFIGYFGKHLPLK